MSTYWQLLKDPRWQQKRLRIMDRDGFSCRHCRSKEKTLNVHHLYYEKGNDPWDYPDEALKTLCQDCHKIAEELKRQLLIAFGQSDEFEQGIIIGFAKARNLISSSDDADDEIFIPGIEQQFGALRGVDKIRLHTHDELMRAKESVGESEDEIFSIKQLMWAVQKEQEAQA